MTITIAITNTTTTKNNDDNDDENNDNDNEDYEDRSDRNIARRLFSRSRSASSFQADRRPKSVRNMEGPRRRFPRSMLNELDRERARVSRISRIMSSLSL